MWVGWIFLLVIPFLALFALHTWSDYQKSRQLAALLAGPTPTLPVEANGVRLRAWADESRVANDAIDEIWVVIENRSDNDLIDLSLAPFATHGFQTIGLCWKGGVPVCLPGASDGRHSVDLPRALAKGRTLTLSAQVRPCGAHGSWNLTSLLTWRDAGRVETALPINIGPIEVEPPPPSWYFSASDSVYSFFKDLGLPITLGLLAYAFQRLNQKRDSRDRILSRATENASRYYLPIVPLGEQIQSYAEQPETVGNDARKRDENLDWALYYILLLTRRMREVSLHGGGFFFRSLNAEKLVVGAWRLFFVAAGNRLGSTERSLVLDQLGEDDSKATFEAKVLLDYTNIRAHGKLRDRLSEWIEGKDSTGTPCIRLTAYTALALLFCEVLQYEINQLYYPWYANEDRDRPADIGKRAVAVKQFCSDSKFSKALNAYLSEIGQKKVQAPPIASG